MSLEHLIVSLGIGVFLLRRTDAVYWYARALGLVSTKYLRCRKEGKNYLEWLVEEHDSFWTELLSCPFCLATWLSLAVLPFYGLEAGPRTFLGIVGTYSLLAFLKAALQKWS